MEEVKVEEEKVGAEAVVEDNEYVAYENGAHVDDEYEAYVDDVDDEYEAYVDGVDDEDDDDAGRRRYFLYKDA